MIENLSLSPREFFEAVLSQIAVELVMNNGDRHLVTWCPRILEFFDIKEERDYYKFVSDDVFIAYAPLIDNNISLKISEVHYPIFVGIPFEIAPPMYINPKLRALMPEDAMYSVQLPFLINIKEYRSLGHYKTILPYNFEKCDHLLRLKKYLSETLNLKFDEHPSLRIFEEDFSGDFHIYTNTTQVRELLAVAPKLVLAPIIYACLDKNINNFSNEVQEYIENTGSYTDDTIKHAWLNFLEKQRITEIKSLTEERETIKTQVTDSFITKLNDGMLLSFVKRYSAFHDVNYNKQAVEGLRLKIVEFLYENSETLQEDNVVEKMTEMCTSLCEILLGSEFSINTENNKTLLNRITQEVYAVFVFSLQIKNMYSVALQEILDVNFKEDLKQINDSRLFLRYWPSAYRLPPEFHNYIRPFTEKELLGIQSLISDNVNINYDSLYMAGPGTQTDILELLNEHKDEVKEKRIKQIQEVSKQRTEEIKAEMEPVYDTLQEEERLIFEDMLNDISDIETYKQELSEENTMYGILSYWPLPLYPKPDNIVSV